MAEQHASPVGHEVAGGGQAGVQLAEQPALLAGAAVRAKPGAEPWEVGLA
jgi:hypothetical protein